MESLVVFGGGRGVRYDAGTNMIVGESSGLVVHEGTDENVELRFAIEPEVAK